MSAHWRDAGHGRRDGGMDGMSQVVATAERVVHAPAERVRAALADYEGTRRRILPEQFSDYRGRGPAARAPAPACTGGSRRRRSGCATRWSTVTQPTDGHPGRVRRNVVHGHRLDGATGRTRASTVRVRTTWNGAGGIGGFFERTFAPKGLRRVYDSMLGRLEAELAG